MKYEIMVVKKLIDGDKIHFINPEENYTFEEIQAFKKGVEQGQNETTKCYVVVDGEDEFGRVENEKA